MFRQVIIYLSQQSRSICFKRFQNHKELNDVQPAFTQFILTDKGGWFPKKLSQLGLGKTRRIAGLNEPRKQVLVSWGMRSSRQ